jgi:hypothetical protein
MVKSMVVAEVFDDFLEMAEHLLANGYKDPAAVVGTTVLETHLRRLCEEHGIATYRDESARRVPKKADALNADLTKAEAYGRLDQKQITALPTDTTTSTR